jgi:dTDP-L-rhamnose 4-epimerase
MNRVLITGGAGFIGNHVARTLRNAGHGVRVLDNLSPQVHGPAAEYRPIDGAEFIRGDVTIRSDMEKALRGIDTIVHLAAETGTGQSMYEIERYYRVNVQGTALLFDILANAPHSVRNFILASSRSVYGEGAYLCRTCAPQGVRRFPEPRSARQLQTQQWTSSCDVCGSELEPTATREDDRLRPASIYAATKLAQEELVTVTCGALGIAHSTLRMQNVFGEGQSLINPYTGMLSIFSTRLRLGLPLAIFEDGQETRDFVHVEDVAQVILFCVGHPAAEGVTLNVGRGEPVSIFGVAQLLSRLMGSSIEPQVTGEYRVGDIRHGFADTSRLLSMTGLHPEISLETGMARFCDWVASQPIPESLLEAANSELKARKLMG